MSSSLVKKMRPGIFGKFLILMIGTGIAISMLLGFYWRNIAHPQERGEFRNHIDHYTSLLAKDLGDPPDREKAGTVAEKLHIGLRFEAKDDVWQTPLFPAAYREDEINRVRRGQLLSAVTTETGRLLFWTRMRAEIETIHAIAMGGIVLALLLGAWLISRYLLRPIRRLKTGMAAVETGVLDIRLAEKGGDEFADLARGFNSMAQNLENMLKDRDRLLADVSHELRSPITRIKVALEFNKDKQTAKTLRAEIAGMQAIITALLDTERLAAGANLEKIEVDKLVATLCKENKVRFNPSATNACVLGSAEKLRIAIRNLMENALRHGKKPVEVSVIAGNGIVTIRVSDSGSGIAAAEREKVFLPFYRSGNAAKHGYGLGLYMTKKIIESMRGKISIGAAQAGSAVEIQLPLL